MSGRGIVLCGGGDRFIASLYVQLRTLVKYGLSSLPIELWHLGPAEMPDKHRRVLSTISPLKIIDAHKIAEVNGHPRIRGGWELKTYAILHSAFEEVLYLDADNYVVANPSYLFDSVPYKLYGAIFWADCGLFMGDNNARESVGVDARTLRKSNCIFQCVTSLPDNYLAGEDDYNRHTLEIEAGQIVLNKRRMLDFLKVHNKIVEQSQYYFTKFYGDKHTMQVALYMLSKKYFLLFSQKFLPAEGIIHGGLYGDPLFCHRTISEYRLGENSAARKNSGMLNSAEHESWLAQLRKELA